MVTEKAAYIGTSNWSADYFQRTAGSALVLQPAGSAPPPGTEPTLRAQLQASFDRDWGSPRARGAPQRDCGGDT
uniref:PLD phosphodiesterase domain-containing protein n=1 Tax=Pavo cristatus TaxID=9049 RepID=A0A8C9G1D0_PAVCR